MKFELVDEIESLVGGDRNILIYAEFKTIVSNALKHACTFLFGYLHWKRPDKFIAVGKYFLRQNSQRMR